MDVVLSVEPWTWGRPWLRLICIPRAEPPASPNAFLLLPDGLGNFKRLPQFSYRFCQRPD